MTAPHPRRAGRFEVGASCPRCSAALEQADRVVACPKCGISHHETCWGMGGGCGSYHCLSGGRMEEGMPAAPDLVILPEDLDAARPLAVPAAARRSLPPPEPAVPERRSRLAAWSLGLSLSGLVLLGLPGAVGAVLGGLALARIAASRGRLGGARLATAGIAVGILATVGWVLGFAVWIDGMAESFEEDVPREVRLEGLPEPIASAMRQTVKINASRAGKGFLRGRERWIGSGVVVGSAGGRLAILTNRHVALGLDGPGDASSPPDLAVRFLDGSLETGKIRWLAPDGVDLALLDCPVPVRGTVDVARLAGDEPLRVGDSLFAVGSPHGFGWTFTRGVVSGFSGLRGNPRQDLEVIQTQTPISPGSSGGGLYLEDGRLVGINTWTVGGVATEGLHFAIGIRGFLKLLEETGESIE